jgi:hypothetical protein
VLETVVRRSLRSLGLSALASVVAATDTSVEAQFLRNHEAIRDDQLDLHEWLERYRSDPLPHDRPLLQLGTTLGLSPIELLATTLAASVETDFMCGRAIAHLQAPVGGSRPTLGLLATALSELGDAGEVMATLLTGVAVESGLLQILNEAAPAAERAVCVPLPLCLAMADEDATARDARWPGTSVGPDADGDVPLPPSTLAEAGKRARGLSQGSQNALVLRSGSRAEAKAVACEIARSLGRRALFVGAENGTRVAATSSGLGPWLLLKQLLPVFCVELGPGERKALPAIPHYDGPRLVLSATDGSFESADQTVPSWTIEMTCKDERVELWKAALGRGAPDSGRLARLLASTHRHSSGRIAHLGRLARFQCAVAGRADPRLEDVRAASWTVEGAGLESLTQALPDPIPDDALVMTPGLRDELNRLLLRCRGREGLVDGLGASAAAKYRPGVRALFTGPSGTGKTLAAGWLATRLSLPLYRVDLAAVTSKYIGETEKNLAQLLARAEHAEVILLFDEADSLFGKRTDVKEANDRFANAQTNYLLQRIESFDGIVFLTSNSRARFDPAFFRRLDTIVDFPVPGPAERRSLWQTHLGPNHELTQRELNQLAAASDLLGGHIRNAVLTAAVLARAGNRRISYGDVIEALGDEYRKLGRQVPTSFLRSA